MRLRESVCVLNSRRDRHRVSGRKQAMLGRGASCACLPGHRFGGDAMTGLSEGRTAFRAMGAALAAMFGPPGGRTENCSARGLTIPDEAPRTIIAGSPDRRIAGSPDRRIAGSPDRRIAGSPDRRIAGSPDRRIAGSPDRRIAGSPDRRIAGSPDRRIAGSPDRRIAGSPFLRAGDGHGHRLMAAPSGAFILPA